MNIISFLKSAAIAAGLFLLALGLAIAEETSAHSALAAPAAETQAQGQEKQVNTNQVVANQVKSIEEQCRGEIAADLRGFARRETMRRCVEAKREAAGLNQRHESATARREAKEKSLSIRQDCREQIRGEKLARDARRERLETCLVQADPSFAKSLSCRREAEAQNLAPRSQPFRDFLRECRARA